MGEVLIRYKITPVDADVDFERVAETYRGYLPEHGRVSRYEIKPFVFGMKMLEWTIILDDKKGGGEELEEKMRNTEGVQDIEVLEMGLL